MLWAVLAVATLLCVLVLLNGCARATHERAETALAGYQLLHWQACEERSELPESLCDRHYRALRSLEAATREDDETGRWAAARELWLWLEPQAVEIGRGAADLALQWLASTLASMGRGGR